MYGHMLRTKMVSVHVYGCSCRAELASIHVFYHIINWGIPPNNNRYLFSSKNQPQILSLDFLVVPIIASL